MISKIFWAYSDKSRGKKVKKFFQLMKAQNLDTLLDAGGSRGMGFTEMWNSFKRVIVVDLTKRNLERAKNEHKHVRVLLGNVCNIPLGDRSVDFVFSNAVIEHIDKEKRCLFAGEIRRVARKGYFITTPNYWFPIDPHYICPFWQYLPEGFKRFFKKYFPLGNYKKGFYERIDLLSKKELKRLFPEANIIGIRITQFIPETLVCWYKGKFLDNI